MGRQIRPARVYEVATAALRTPLMRKYPQAEPPWYSVVYNHPPAEKITRAPAVKLRNGDPKQKRPRNVYRPQQITFPEDALRQTFYKDHPWELARPRMILEMDGKDSYNLDWSKGVRQPGMALSGECVVQRQLWLMDNGMPKSEAYDIARRELYAIRQEEEVERRIAKEEAQFVGAYFGKSRLEIGHQIEGVEHERWKTWAAAEIEKARALRAEMTPQTARSGRQGPVDVGGGGPTHDLAEEL